MPGRFASHNVLCESRFFYQVQRSIFNGVPICTQHIDSIVIDVHVRVILIILKLNIHSIKSMPKSQCRASSLLLWDWFYLPRFLSGYLMYIKPRNIYMCWTLRIYLYISLLQNCYCSNIWHKGFFSKNFLVN